MSARIIPRMFLPEFLPLSAGAAEYTDCTSAEVRPNKFSGYDTKQSNGEVPVMLGLWGMLSTPLLPLLQGPLWSRMVAPDRAL